MANVVDDIEKIFNEKIKQNTEGKPNMNAFEEFQRAQFFRKNSSSAMLANIGNVLKRRVMI